jgi:DNA segregation ATPase FtsK/SpoIIIE-like protein
MMVSLCHATSPAQLQIVFCDPKFDEDYTALATLPHVTMVNEPADCIRAIAAVHAELERRKRSPSPSRVILFIDEYADLKGAQADDGDALSRMMAQITAVGRSKGIHVMLATQKPTTEIVDTVAKGNLTVRIGGAVMTPKESEIAMGRGQVGCETLEGRGAFYAVLGGGRLIRIQSYMLDGQTLERATEDVADRWQGVEPMRIEMGDVTFVQPAPPAEAMDNAMIGRVLESMALDAIFDESGELLRGARAQILRLLFDGADDKGTPGRTVDRILDKMRYMDRA